MTQIINIPVIQQKPCQTNGLPTIKGDYSVKKKEKKRVN